MSTISFLLVFMFSFLFLSIFFFFRSKKLEKKLSFLSDDETVRLEKNKELEEKISSLNRKVIRKEKEKENDILVEVNNLADYYSSLDEKAKTAKWPLKSLDYFFDDTEIFRLSFLDSDNKLFTFSNIKRCYFTGFFSKSYVLDDSIPTIISIMNSFRGKPQGSIIG